MQKQVSQSLIAAMDLKQVQKKQKIFKRLKQNRSKSMGRNVDEIYRLERKTTCGC